MYYLCHDKVDFGTTPLMRASLKGRVEMVRVLLENGAAVDKQDDVMQNSVYLFNYDLCIGWGDTIDVGFKKWPLRGGYRGVGTGGGVGAWTPPNAELCFPPSQ